MTSVYTFNNWDTKLSIYLSKLFLHEVTCYKLPQHLRSVLSIIVIYNSPNAIFDDGLFQLKGETSYLFTILIRQGTKKYTYCIQVLLFWKTESLLCFGIGGPSFFLRVAITMISKRFIKLGIIVHTEYGRIYEVKMTFKTLLFAHLLKIAYKGVRVNSKIFRKSSLKFTFGQKNQTQSRIALDSTRLEIFNL